MLKIVKSLKELPFSALMEVYIEGNLEKGDLLTVEQDFYQYLKEGFFTQPEDCYCLWEVDGELVSALRLQGYKDGLLLEALETAPAQRRKGYAESLVRAVLEVFSDRKIYVHIVSGNRPSISLHKKCGFFKTLDHAVYADGSVTRCAATYVKERRDVAWQ